MKIYKLLYLGTALLLSGCGGADKPTSTNLPNYVGEVGLVRWVKPEVTYSINSYSFFFDADATIERGLRKWEPALDGHIKIRRVKDGSHADIEIFLKPEAQVGDFGNWGQTDLEYADVNKQTLKHATIHIWKSLLPWQMESTATHEAGHGLCGIQGHPSNDGNVMYFQIPRTFTKSPSVEDLNTVKYNYSRK